MKTIVLASVLKPVDEPRMYEKIGLTLASQQEFEVNIIGFKTKNLPEHPSIHFFPLFSFRRLDTQRLMAPFRFFKLISRLKPDILIIGTHELLIPSLLFKLLYKTRLIYDVQENYYANLRYTSVFPPIIKTFLAAFVRIKERMAYPFLKACLLAEKSYLKEMPWLKNKSIVLENKFKKMGSEDTLRSKQEEDTINLIFSGTIGEHYGIFEAINLVKKLHAKDQRIRLNIAGFTAQQRIHERVLSVIKNEPYIRYIGGTRPLPHREILSYIKKADFALLPYQRNRSTQNRMPTKFFEYACFKIPMITSENPVWKAFMDKHQAGITINFEKTKPGELLQLLDERTFYGQYQPDNFSWESEEKKLLQLVKSL